ncbi:hypothetical protein DOO78_22885 [Roseicella frigidaeris]|uniref:PIN domain-containing protein n=1 Tax=Roseicella frigidaeris TaxID=2230885 RepID=A0A327LZK3_9PROT|nr:hypothetical protein DOO78_22885 [Roseicella frigidaeris]
MAGAGRVPDGGGDRRGACGAGRGAALRLRGLGLGARGGGAEAARPAGTRHAGGAVVPAALALTGARLATVSVAVAAEASAVPAVYGSGDPGDCFIIATARVRRLPVVTRDGRMLALAVSAPDYLEAVEC